MNSVDKRVVLHCLKSMIDEEVCEECLLYGVTGTDHCEKDCLRFAINAIEGIEEQPKNEYKRGWTDALSMALHEAHTIHTEDGVFDVVQAETLIGLGLLI